MNFKTIAQHCYEYKSLLLLFYLCVHVVHYTSRNSATGFSCATQNMILFIFFGLISNLYLRCMMVTGDNVIERK